MLFHRHRKNKYFAITADIKKYVGTYYVIKSVYRYIQIQKRI